MGRYIFTKQELIKELEQLSDSDFIMVNLSGHTKPDYPITHIEDSTSVGFWELRCDSSIDFREALEQQLKKRIRIIMHGLILLGVLAIIFGIVLRIWGEAPFLDVSCIILGCFMLLIGISINNVPTAMDVYQNKTTLEIIYRDGVPVDSVVVFKDKKE